MVAGDEPDRSLVEELLAERRAETGQGVDAADTGGRGATSRPRILDTSPQRHRARARAFTGDNQRTRRKGWHSWALRFPAGSVAVTQKRSKRLLSLFGTSQRTATLRVPTANTIGTSSVAISMPFS